MTNNENLIPIPGRLHSVATEGHVAGADEIYDDNKGKLQSIINSEVSTELENKIPISQKGVAEGVASLDNSGKVPSLQLPSYVDDVVNGYFYNGNFYKEAAHTTVITNEEGKIYVDIPTSKSYRWSGSAYILISNPYSVDEEDLTTVNNNIKFKDRPNIDGMGKVILRKNMVSSVNTLTQSMMQATNTIYVIRYDFTLGEDITVPANCVLKFDGGSISAGSGENMDTITGNNTNIMTDAIAVFGNNINISGTWKVEYVLLDWFEPDSNGYYDNSFKNALKVCKTLHCTTHKTYNFSGELVDCRDMYGTLLITGNKCSFRQFFFAYDIKSDDNPHIDSAVGTFKYIINGINFIGNYANEKPCLFFAAAFEIYNCNFADYANVIGCTPRYLDCVTLCNIHTWNKGGTRMNLFKVFDYSFTPTTGFIADWFSINNVHSPAYICIGIRDQINLTMANSLHIMFDFANDPTNYNYAIVTCYAVNCHWENSKPIILNNNHHLNTGNTFIFDKCYLYSTALPQNSKVMEFVEFRDTKIQYFNSNNYENLPDLHKSITTLYNIMFDGSILKYNSSLFENYYMLTNRIISGTITPPDANSYYFFSKSFALCPKSVYTSAQNVKYIIAYSTREDVLYNGGNTPTVYWSKDFHIDVNKINCITVYINRKPNSFVHIFRKDIDNNTIQHIVFRASWLLVDTGNDSSVMIVDTKLGVFGYPWQEYTGQEEDIKYFATV